MKEQDPLYHWIAIRSHEAVGRTERSQIEKQLKSFVLFHLEEKPTEIEITRPRHEEISYVWLKFEGMKDRAVLCVPDRSFKSNSAAVLKSLKEQMSVERLNEKRRSENEAAI